MEHVLCRALVFVVVFRLPCVVLKIICSYCAMLYRLITTYFEFKLERSTSHIELQYISVCRPSSVKTKHRQ